MFWGELGARAGAHRKIWGTEQGKGKPGMAPVACVLVNHWHVPTPHNSNMEASAPGVGDPPEHTCE